MNRERKLPVRSQSISVESERGASHFLLPEGSKCLHPGRIRGFCILHSKRQGQEDRRLRAGQGSRGSAADGPSLRAREGHRGSIAAETLESIERQRRSVSFSPPWLDFMMLSSVPGTLVTYSRWYGAGRAKERPISGLFEMSGTAARYRRRRGAR
jgi:hypothetical protein